MKSKSLADVQWDVEHPTFKGNTFGELKIGLKSYTLVKGWMAEGGYSIGGTIDGKYQEIDGSEEDINDIISRL